jgi:hypothetical protein
METPGPSHAEVHAGTRQRLERYRNCRSSAYKSGALAVIGAGSAYFLGGYVISRRLPWLRQNLFGTSLGELPVCMLDCRPVLLYVYAPLCACAAVCVNELQCDRAHMH